MRLHPEPVGSAGLGRRVGVAVLLAVLTVLAGCGDEEGKVAPPAVAGVELVEVPKSDLSGSQPAVREQVEAARRSLETLLGAEDRQPAELARAYGRLGMLYHAYELDQAAAACYRNARSLDPEEPGWSYYLGMLLQRGGDLEESLTEFERVIEAQPGDVPTLLRLGAIRLRLDRLEAALAAYRRAAELAPESAAAHYGLGRAAARGGDTQLAVRELEQALELQPQATRIHYQLASVLRAAGEMERAAYHLERQGPVDVAYADPRQAELLLLTRSTATRVERAARLSSEGRLPEAVREFRAALAEDPGSVEARRGLASVLALTGRLAEAEEIYRALLEESSEDAALHQRLGRVLEGRGRVDEALASYRAAARLLPDLGGLHGDLARALHLDGRHQESLSEYDAAIAETPEDRGLRYQRAVVLAAAGRAAEAVAAIDRLIGEAPDDLDFRLAAARGLAGMGRLEEMARQCRAVLAAADATPGQRARASHNLGTWRLQQGDLAEADRLFAEAVTADPRLRPAQMAWGRTLTALGRHRQAAERFAAAAALRPADPIARLAEAEALIAAGLERAARLRLEEAVQALPDDPRPAHRLARLLATAADDQVREGRLALQLAQKLLEESRSALHAETVAMALAEIGDFEAAVRLQRALISQAEAEADSRYLQRLRENLERYERGEPIRGR